MSTDSPSAQVQKAFQDVVRLPLRQLGLRSGMALQTRRLVEGTSKTEAQFFGAIEGKGVMVGPAGADAAQTGLTTGDVCVVRGFTGVYEFSFISKVLQTFEVPFAYALLAYPAQVDAKQVRQSLRTKVAWPAEAFKPDGKPLASLQLVDLSPYGAMVRSEDALGNIGETVMLKLSAQTPSVLVEVTLQAKICHHSRPMGTDKYIAGLAFQQLSQDDIVKLHFLVSGNALEA